MGSRHKRREGRVLFGALALIMAVVAGCSTAGATSGDAGPLASGVRLDLPTESAAVSTGGPGASGGTVTVNQITATYIYRGELITPLAHLYGKFLASFVVITVQNDNSSPVRIIAMSEIPGYTTQAKDTIDVPAGGSQEILQNPRLTTAAIDSLNSEHQADVHVTVSYMDNGQPRTVLDQTSTTLISSRRDFPWKIEGFSDHEVHELLAAMVMPRDPSVEQLIRTAANYRTDHAMGATTTAEDALDEMRAIWEAEQKDYALYYVSTTESFEAASQRIRLPGEVLTENGGNCIEFTLLYASAAESLGLHSYLVLVPGHAYFLVDLDGQGINLAVIEGTMIRGSTFQEALDTGTAELNKAAAHLKAGDAEYDLVDVAAARKKGVTPIEWH